MATYIVLINLTDQGTRNVKQTPERIMDRTAAAEKLGVKIKEVYLTMGPYDSVVVAEAPSEDAMTAWALDTASQGNIHTQTMRAFSASEMNAILSMIP